jgi:predicted CXXCH cytochrome family protein
MANYRRRRFAAAAVVIAIVCAGTWLSIRHRNPASTNAPSPTLEDDSDAATVTSSRSPYLNTTMQATYAGSLSCVGCHDAEHRGFTATPHHHALSPVVLENEPPDAEFHQWKSGRMYRVYRKDGRLWHREVVPADGDEPELVLNDYPVKYAIGSGRHSRSYLIEIDGFLVESPLTWYASKKSWDMSPGYDRVDHPAFSRPAHEGCVSCHSGRVESVGKSTHRLRFDELTINCESCHGPGSMHVKRRSQGEPVNGIDFTIVHPAKLSRSLNEAICARCHLRSTAFANVRGRHRSDFRPGLPLTDFRLDFQPQRPTASMKVVGHFEQIYQSRCYTQSTTLTCTTCHNPHASPAASERTAYYRRKCLSCHQATGGCKLPEKLRRERNPANDCVTCHMPRTETNIPHFAFTHHRIGLKNPTKYEEPLPNLAVRLKPVGDVSQVSQIDRERCLGLAYVRRSSKVPKQVRGIYLDRAIAHLQVVMQAGVRDAAVLDGIARVLWERKSRECIEFARAALRSPDCSPVIRIHSLIVLGDGSFESGDIAAAEAAFTKLTKLRRWDGDWQMVGVCRDQKNDHEGAILAFRKALAIRPDRPELHRLLAEACARAGHGELARKHGHLARRLQTLRLRQRAPRRDVDNRD